MRKVTSKLAPWQLRKLSTLNSVRSSAHSTDSIPFMHSHVLLNDRTCSEKRVLKWFCCCVNITEHTDTNLGDTARCAPGRVVYHLRSCGSSWTEMSLCHIHFNLIFRFVLCEKWSRYFMRTSKTILEAVFWMFFLKLLLIYLLLGYFK